MYNHLHQGTLLGNAIKYKFRVPSCRSRASGASMAFRGGLPLTGALKIGAKTAELASRLWLGLN